MELEASQEQIPDCEIWGVSPVKKIKIDLVPTVKRKNIIYRYSKRYKTIKRKTNIYNDNMDCFT